MIRRGFLFLMSRQSLYLHLSEFFLKALKFPVFYPLLEGVKQKSTYK